MHLDVIVGDLLERSADVLLVSANPWLQMTGGVNGAIRARGNQSVQDELNRHLAKLGTKALPQGSVVPTGPGNLRARLLLHCVAIDPFYGSSADAVARTITNALRAAAARGCRTAAMPMLATGYGPLGPEEFACGLRAACADDFAPLESLTVVVRQEEERATIVRTLGP